MSSYGKLLAPIVVPTGGWDFAFSDGATRTVTVPAATYASALHLAAALQTALDVSYTPTVTISSTGTVTITITEMTGAAWGSTNDDLQEALGFSGSETVSGTSLVSTNPHAWGWYPGTLSYGSANGVGLTADSRWQAVDSAVSATAGSGKRRVVGPTRPAYERSLTFGLIRSTEAFDNLRGPIRLQDRWRYSELLWYPDRSVGTVGSYGTQRDPGSPYYNTSDASPSRWDVTLVENPRFTADSASPDLFTVQLKLNAEPI